MRLCATAIGALLLAAASVGSAAAATCESLTGLTLPNTTITLAKSFAGGTFTAPNGQNFANMPALCQVHGVATPTSASAINFEVWLPAASWNGRLEGLGNSLYPGLERGGEVGWGPAGGQFVINRTTSSGVSSFDWFRFAVFDNPNWDFRTFNFDSDAALGDADWAAIANSTDPDIEPFRSLGHKMIYYHGFADPLIPAFNGINYYESVVADQARRRHGDGDRDGALAETREFFRAFMVPGMYHCAGGPGPTIFAASSGAAADAEHDVLSALVEWVEHGVAPRRIVATKFLNDNAANGIAFQRPLCPYPEVAAYRGFGDPTSAQSFTCATDDRDSASRGRGGDDDHDRGHDRD